MAHKKVYLIRHGKTDGNLRRAFIGRGTDEGLSREGALLAEAAREEILHEIGNLPERIFVSPMKRAMETASILFEETPQVVIQDLEEIGFGILEGKTHEELEGDPRYEEWLEGGGKIEIPDGETIPDFSKRSFAAFRKTLGDSGDDETVVIVCHGGNIMAVLSTLTGTDYYDFLTENLCGFCLDLETDDERIRDAAWHRIGPWSGAGSDHR